MIAFQIMERLQNRCTGFEYGNINIDSVFFVDDGIVLEESMEAARKSIKMLREICKDHGLEINLNKSRALIFHRNIMKLKGYL